MEFEITYNEKNELIINEKSLSKTLKKSREFDDEILDSLITKLFHQADLESSVGALVQFLKSESIDHIRVIKALMCLFDISLGKASMLYQDHCD